MLARKAALVEQIKEIDVQTESETSGQRQSNGNYTSKVDLETERIKGLLNPQLSELKERRGEAIDALKMSAASPELLKFFSKLKEDMSGLLKETQSLPPITDIKQIGNSNGKR